jgi:hypothetical protein
MLSFQLKQELEVLLRAYEEAQDFREGLKLINEAFPVLNDLLSRLAESSSKGNEAANNMREHLNQLRKKVAPISPRKFFASMEEFQSQLAAASGLRIEDLGLINQIASRIDAFAENYENYIKSYTAQAAGPLIVEARTLSEMLDGFHLAVRLAYVNLEGEPLAENEMSLTIYLPDSMPLDQFAARLLAIHRLYQELAHLMGVDLSQAPLRLQKIESGSFWAKVFGDSRVIKFIVESLRASASFIYRNYTEEGRLGAVPQKLDSLNAVMDFSNRLKEQGVDISEIHEQLRLSAVHIAKDINVLVGGQSSVTINGETQSVGAEVQKSLESFSTRQRIGHVQHTDNNALPSPVDGLEGGEGEL